MNQRNLALVLLVTLTAISLLPLSCSKQTRIAQTGPISASTIVATVDTMKIPLGEVLQEYTKQTSPNAPVAPTLENALDEVIYRRCAYLLTKDFKDYDKKEIHRLAQNRTHDFVIGYMMQDLFDNKIRIPDASVDSAYRVNIAKFSTPERRSVTQILMSTNPKAWEASGINVSGLSAAQLDAKAKEQIDEYYRQVKGGADIGELALKFSHDTNSKPNRGSTGLFEKGQMVAEFEKVAFKLPKGAVSPPFKTEFGWHILRVDEIRDSMVTPLDSALRENIRTQLKSFDRTIMVSSFVDSVDTSAKLEWNEPLLQKEPGGYDPLDWVCVVNGTDTINAGILKELELVFRTGGRRGPVTPDVRKQIVLSKLSPYAMASAARQLGYFERDTVQQVYNNLARQEIMGRIYRDRTIVSSELPTEAELKSYYESHKSDFISDKPLKVQHIIFKDSIEAADVKSKLEAGADFKELAMKYYPGDPKFKEEAFDLGWISEKEMGTDFYNAAWLVGVGKYAGPVQTKWGWHVIKVVDRKSMKNFDAARLDVQELVRAEAAKDSNRKWIAMVTKGRDIVKYDDILSQIDLTKRDRYFQLADSLAQAKTVTETVKSGS